MVIMAIQREREEIDGRGRVENEEERRDWTREAKRRRRC